ncbi:hypothetical protein niasHS_006782 [Heterodera schachtii]|uniref:Mitochondrial 2-oxodicarboxylate carrier n=1 Tax=Heterodera schachtii TaxID=97005 RepID=A0ABD2JI96_HETSC
MERAKEAGRQFVAGGTAGMVEVCLMHPLDLVKTRLQMGGGHYAGLTNCFGQTFRREGVSGFYKGILPPILAETPKRATKFLTFEQYKRALAPVATHWHLPPRACLSLAGLFCGLTEAFVICPFEVVKVRLQTELTVSLSEQRSSAAIAREIIRADGIGTGGIYRGIDSIRRGQKSHSGPSVRLWPHLPQNLANHSPHGGLPHFVPRFGAQSDATGPRRGHYARRFRDGVRIFGKIQLTN